MTGSMPTAAIDGPVETDPSHPGTLMMDPFGFFSAELSQGSHCGLPTGVVEQAELRGAQNLNRKVRDDHLPTADVALFGNQWPIVG